MFGKKKQSPALPPTPYGYQPPPDAVVRSWQCTNLKCGHGEHGPDRRAWPPRCPECGSSIGTGYLDPPYRRPAERFELDVKLVNPKDEF